VAICAYCTGVSIFTAGLQQEAWPTDKPMPEEVALAQLSITIGLRKGTTGEA
jgi:hypothetical protein